MEFKKHHIYQYTRAFDGQVTRIIATETHIVSAYFALGWQHLGPASELELLVYGI